MTRKIHMCDCCGRDTPNQRGLCRDCLGRTRLHAKRSKSRYNQDAVLEQMNDRDPDNRIDDEEVCFDEPEDVESEEL